MSKSWIVLALASTLCLFAGSASAAGLGGCEISKDRLSVVVNAKGDGTKGYQCQVTCRARVENQRAFEVVRCSYRLGANAAEKTYCQQKAVSGGKFTEIATGDYQCVPR